MQLANKIVVVTGAGSGIGRELSLQLVHRGACVAGVDINADALKETGILIRSGQEQFQAFKVDITNKQQVDALPNHIIEHLGSVDGLINNAGIIQPFKRVQDMSDAEIQRVMNVNFWGTLQLTRAFLPYLLQRPEAHIVNISSMGGFLAVPGQTLYGAAKAAVKLFTEGLHSELAGTSVHVTVVFPGAIATNITQNSGLGKPTSGGNSSLKPLPPAKAAQLILDGVVKNKFRVVVGKDAQLLDALYRLHPRLATSFIQKKMKALLA